MAGHNKHSERIGRWYFGGFASAGAAMCTHPLDMIKVRYDRVHV